MPAWDIGTNLQVGVSVETVPRQPKQMLALLTFCVHKLQLN